MGEVAANTVDPLSAIYKLRGDLRFTPQPLGEELVYIVEDCARSKYYRVGFVEYALMSQLQGHTSLSDALAAVRVSIPEGTQFSERQALSLAGWLVNAELAEPVSFANRPTEAARSKRMLSPISLRVPLLNPDRLISAAMPWLKWLFSPVAMLGWLSLILHGGYVVMQNWDRFVIDSREVFITHNWLWLTAVTIVLKIAHELGHGVVCKKYGGYVRECGVTFILLVPLAYTDVTSSWRFRSRWQRIHVAVAGIYVELLIAALAAIVWSSIAPGRFSVVCVNCIVMASVTTILFNANPLMRFDGYYMLSDLLSLPNLYTSGQRYVQYLARRFILGMRSLCPIRSGRGWLIIRCYGIAAFFWRLLVCAGLLIGAAALFHGAGIVLAALAIVAWMLAPTSRVARFLISGDCQNQPRRLRFALVSSAAIVFVVSLFTWIPWPFRVAAPAVVEFAPLTWVRAGSPGFVSEVRVRSGDTVAQGQIIAKLNNDELQREYNDLQLELQSAKLTCRVYQNQQELAAYQAELKNVEALDTRLREKSKQLEMLTLRAPSAGQVIGRNLDSLAGTYLKEGDAILAIGDAANKEIQVSIAQDDIGHYTARLGQDVVVRLSGQPELIATLQSIDPRASCTPPHPSLCSSRGGPLPVTVHNSDSDNSITTPQEKLLQPRFVATVPLSATQSTILRAGQRSRVYVSSHDMAFGEVLYQSATNWVRDRFRSAQQ